MMAPRAHPRPLIKADGGVVPCARTLLPPNSDPNMIIDVMNSCSIPVMSLAHRLYESKVLRPSTSTADESEVLTAADETHHIDKRALRSRSCARRPARPRPRLPPYSPTPSRDPRISEGAAMIRLKGNAGMESCSPRARLVMAKSRRCGGHFYGRRSTAVLLFPLQVREGAPRPRRARRLHPRRHLRRRSSPPPTSTLMEPRRQAPVQHSVRLRRARWWRAPRPRRSRASDPSARRWSLLENEPGQAVVDALLTPIGIDNPSRPERAGPGGRGGRRIAEGRAGDEAASTGNAEGRAT